MCVQLMKTASAGIPAASETDPRHSSAKSVELSLYRSRYEIPGYGTAVGRVDVFAAEAGVKIVHN